MEEQKRKEGEGGGGRGEYIMSLTELNNYGAKLALQSRNHRALATRGSTQKKQDALRMITLCCVLMPCRQHRSAVQGVCEASHTAEKVQERKYSKIV